MFIAITFYVFAVYFLNLFAVASNIIIFLGFLGRAEIKSLPKKTGIKVIHQWAFISSENQNYSCLGDFLASFHQGNQFLMLLSIRSREERNEKKRVVCEKRNSYSNACH